MTCSVPGCAEPRFKSTSTCYAHWLDRPRCEVEGCERLVVRKSKRCAGHNTLLHVGPIRMCAFDGCDRRATWAELCHPHARQKRRGKELAPLKEKRYQQRCDFEGCGRPQLAAGYCATHYNQHREGSELKPIPKDKRGPKAKERGKCAFASCDRLARGHTGFSIYCNGHADQARHGKQLKPLYLSRGNGHINPGGYRLVRVAGTPMLEHRAVMQEHLGRPLEPFETIHHLNGDRLDNRLENLELWVNKQPRGQRVSDVINFVLKYYRDQVIERLDTIVE